MSGGLMSGGLMSGGRMSGGRMSGGRLSGGLKSYDLFKHIGTTTLYQITLSVRLLFPVYDGLTFSKTGFWSSDWPSG